MEYCEPLNPTRSCDLPRSPASVSSLPSPFPSYLPRADIGSAQFSFDFSPPADQDLQSYGITSGAQSHCNVYQSQPPKRRKLDTRSPMPPPNPSSLSGAEQKEPRIVQAQRRDNGRHLGMPTLPESLTTPSEVQSGSYLIRRMADLGSLLCPCCGFGWEQPDGYQLIPEASSVVYGPERPYSVERPPSMHFPVSQSYSSAALRSDQQPFFQGNQSSIESSPRIMLPPQDHQLLSTLSDKRETRNYQQDGPSLQYYTDRDVKQEPRMLSEHSLFEPGIFLGGSSPPVQYSSHIIESSRHSIFYPHDIGPPSTLSHLGYSVVPSDATGNSPIPDSWNNVSQHDKQSNFDILQPNQRGGKRGPFKDPNLREQTAQTRKIGSCIRCRMQRIRCEHNSDEPTGPCLTCKKVAHTKAGRLPCLRYKITDVRLYKPGQVPGYEWTKRWIDSVSDPIQKWVSPEIRTIHVSDGYSDHCLELRVRKFIPQDGDKLERTWSHEGAKVSVSIPPYALVDLEDGKAAYTKHIHESMNQAFSNILGRPGGLLHKTYQQTLQCCKDQSTPMESLALLRDTFRLWMSIRFSTKSCFIAGEDTLGMPKDILDDTSPTPGKVPLPPVLGAQLDLVLIHHIQTKLRRQVLDRLEKMASKRKHNTWMVTYLVTFVLLHNTALITAHDAGYARKHGMKRRFAREEKVREYHLGANILLAHFHYCNKGVHPFSDDCKDQDLRTLAGLDEDQIHFIHATRTYVRQHKKEWEDLRARGDYENDYFFVSQLFEENWQPRSTV